MPQDMKEAAPLTAAPSGQGASSVRDELEAGITRHKSGEVRAALTVYERLSAREPDNARMLRYLGLAKFQLGERAGGLNASRRAATLNPGCAPTRSDLGRMHAIAGDLRRAIECFRAAVTINPRYADGWHNLGAALRQARDTSGALDAYRQALVLDPERADTYLNLGNLLVDDNQPENAIESFKRAARRDPRLAQARACLAGELSGRGDVSEAEFVYRQAIALDSGHAQAWFGLGRTLEDRGDATQAEHCYRRVLALKPAQPWALGQLLGLSTENRDEDDSLMRTARGVLHDAGAPHGARALIGYGLGKRYDRRGDYDAAFVAFETANRARRAQAGAFDAAEFEQRIERLIDVFSEEFFAQRKRFGIGADLPVFIVGMPRSGTTLTEQILDSHPRMRGAGEAPHLSRLVGALPGKFSPDKLSSATVWPGGAAQLSAMHVHETAHAYLDQLRARVPADILRVSDKSPLNFFHLGVVALMFPNARIAHCRRNPIDTCLSIYFENFRASQTHATDLDDLAVYYRGYERLMAHWRRVLPLKMHELVYEDSVADIETQARALIRLLGLSWDARCLDFHRSQRAVQTPSRWQVRQPIYASSVGRWRRYAGHIAPLLRHFPQGDPGQ